VAFWHDEADRAVECASIDRWLEALVRSMENGTLELA
jgi:hypothetical protein